MNFVRYVSLSVAFILPTWHAEALRSEDNKNEMPVVGALVPIDSVPGAFKSIELDHKTLSPNGSIYAGFYRDGWDETISIHDTETGRQIQRIVGHGDFVERLRFSPDGKVLATFSPRRGWKIWDVATGTLMLELPR